MEVRMIRKDGRRLLCGLRPVYRNAEGEISGQQNGPTGKFGVLVKAKPGYVVGGLRTISTRNVDAVSVLFFRVEGTGLKTTDTYSTEWIGEVGNGSEALLGGTGEPVVGIQGIATQGGDISGLELLVGLE
jgi:hypothetical protein